MATKKPTIKKNPAKTIPSDSPLKVVNVVFKSAAYPPYCRETSKVYSYLALERWGVREGDFAFVNTPSNPRTPTLVRSVTDWQPGSPATKFIVGIERTFPVDNSTLLQQIMATFHQLSPAERAAFLRFIQE